ncbi:30S ribosomal protein 3, chloroplastic-like protein [Tanacetum coccineum]
MEKPRLVSKFIWIEKNIEIALDQVIPRCGTIPVTEIITLWQPSGGASHSKLPKVSKQIVLLEISSNAFCRVLQFCDEFVFEVSLFGRFDFVGSFVAYSQCSCDIDNMSDKLNGSDHVALEKNGMQKRRRASSSGACVLETINKVVLSSFVNVPASKCDNKEGLCSTEAICSGTNFDNTPKDEGLVVEIVGLEEQAKEFVKYSVLTGLQLSSTSAMHYYLNPNILMTYNTKHMDHQVANPIPALNVNNHSLEDPE